MRILPALSATMFALTMGLAGMSAASAMPANGLVISSTELGDQETGSIEATGSLTQVGWRCGRGWHMNRWGRCVPNRW